jgi:hypothetical protein
MSRRIAKRIRAQQQESADCIESWRDLAEVNPRLPILAVTGFDARGYQHLLDKGLAVLQKPFATSWLLLNLETILVPYRQVDASGGLPRFEAAGRTRSIQYPIARR